MKLVHAMFKHKSASICMNFAGGKKTAVVLTDLIAQSPRKGHGSKLMKDVVAYADMLGRDLLLEAVADRVTISQSNLVKFYKRFGFEKIGPGKPVIMRRKAR